MGNRQSNSSSMEAELGSNPDGATVYCEENAATIEHMKRVMERDSIRLFDRESGLNVSVPFIEQVENSTIFNRRKALTEFSLQSSSAGSLPRKPKSRSNRRKLPKTGKPNPLVPALHYLEELESPTLLCDMMEFSFSNSLSRLNY